MESVGYKRMQNGKVWTYQIEGLEQSVLEPNVRDEFRKPYHGLLDENKCITVNQYHVPIWGDGHNLYPQEVARAIEENKLLPGIIRKQADFLYGKGIYIYKETVVGESEGAKIKSLPVQPSDIVDWLNSWPSQGVPSVEEYVRALCTDYYITNTCVTQYHFSKSRRSPNGSGRQMPVRALSYVGSDEARLATDSYNIAEGIKSAFCKFVVVGDWLRPGSGKFAVYHRLDASRPFAQPTAIAFNAAHTFGRHVYAYNPWYNGLRDWVKASNLTPKYLNSYLKNALNSHVHVSIPASWVNAQRDQLTALCLQNLHEASAEKRVRSYKGVQLVDPVTNRPYAYSVNMLEDLISNELEKVTQMLSGEGKNQGKLYATIKMGQEGWAFEDFPGKFKEYFQSVIDYDKRADQVTLAGMGINSSITNVEDDGVISKSGSDVYYNYVVYIASLSYAEHFVLQELNRALSYNFPEQYADGVRIGLQHDIPLRQQEINPADRL